MRSYDNFPFHFVKSRLELKFAREKCHLEVTDVVIETDYERAKWVLGDHAIHGCKRKAKTRKLYLQCICIKNKTCRKRV